MHKHLSAPEHRHEQHRLVSSYKASNRLAAKQHQQPSAEANSGSTLAKLKVSGSSERAGSGSSTPNSMGFVSISPSAAHPDPTSAAWEAVEQFYPNISSSQQQPAGGPLKSHLAGSASVHAAAAAAAYAKQDGMSAGARSSPKATSTAAVAAAAASRLNVALSAAISRGPSGTTAAAAGEGEGGGKYASAGSGTFWGSATATDQVAASAAVPLPVSTQPRAEAAAASALKSVSPSKQQSQQEFRFKQQQQQQHQQQQGSQAGDGDLATSLGSAFGVRISGSLMAAFGGWVVNEAVTAATTAIAGASDAAEPDVLGRHGAGAEAVPVTPAAAGAGASGAAAAAATTASGGRWSLSGLLGSSRKATPHSGRSGRSGACEGSGSGQQQLLSGDAAGGASASAGRGFSFWIRGSSDDAGKGYDDSDGDLISDDSFGEERGIDKDELQLADEEFDDSGAAGRAGSGYTGLLGAAGGILTGHGISGSREKANSREQVLAGAGRSRQLLMEGQPGVGRRVKLLRQLLLWQDKGASAKALALGMYVILLIGNIPRGLHYMQLTTLLPALALLCLVYNAAKPWAIRAYCSISGKSAPSVLDSKMADFEAFATGYIISWSRLMVSELGSWCLALLVLSHRALKGRRFTTSVWTAISLWLLLLLSELRLMNQTLLAMLAFAGLFGVPWCYYRFRSIIDAAVCDALHLVTLLALHAERWAYAVALLAAAVAWQLLAAESGEGNLVVQGSGAAAAALAVLVWRVVAAEV